MHMLHLAFNILNVCHIEREIFFVSSIKENRIRHYHIKQVACEQNVHNNTGKEEQTQKKKVYNNRRKKKDDISRR